ncbi:hypothetical protein CEY16_04440 [Halalkalibacillus sediminis]|uniref:NfeD-like C-terminal domain-containing protein n=1 Tax=Halalkalibacillus sediminis TaxID=2018042 RepID=A0A2I0QXE0_9BACI|nr:NfeD family protein [Halalkalibacillus sediminis]PKR79003.1 hypothetical protein CEY16_04440 [Halalkalibacillus sediminis]
MFIETALGAFLITAVAMFFLFGELIVKLKGLGAILGLGAITFYFSGHLSSFDLIWIMVTFAVGLLMVILDGKFINDGTIGVLGFIILIFSVGFAAPNWLLAVYSITGVIIGAFGSLFLMKVLPKRGMWTKIALFDQMTSDKGYNSMNDSYKELLNQEGITSTDLRPTGSIRVNDQEYSAVSKGKWIEKGKKVQVTNVDGTKILVEEI